MSFTKKHTKKMQRVASELGRQLANVNIRKSMMDTIYAILADPQHLPLVKNFALYESVATIELTNINGKLLDEFRAVTKTDPDVDTTNPKQPNTTAFWFYSKPLTIVLEVTVEDTQIEMFPNQERTQKCENNIQ